MSVVKPRRAIVLAAGRGSRLGGLTTERPKCLVPVLGRTLLDWQIDALSAAGVTEIGIVRGYLREQMQRPDVTYFDNLRWAETNMVRSLECAASWLSVEPCFIAYADLIYFPSTVGSLGRADAAVALSYDRNWRSQWEARFGNPLIDAETFRVDADDNVIDIGRKPQSLDEINGQYMGLLKCTPEGWRSIEAALASLPAATVDRLDMTSLLGSLIGSGVRIRGVGITDPWFEVDSERDLAVCERELAHLRSSHR